MRIRRVNILSDVGEKKEGCKTRRANLEFGN